MTVRIEPLHYEEGYEGIGTTVDAAVANAIDVRNAALAIFGMGFERADLDLFLQVRICDDGSHVVRAILR